MMKHSLKHLFNSASTVAKLSRRALKLALCFTASTSLQLSADVNVLIIGSAQDTSDLWFINADSEAFSPTGIKTELENILGETDLGTVNVQLEERYQNISGDYSTNLLSWFFFPHPAGVETATRWPNLRNQGTTEWDYIVVIGDPYTMEKMPGLYTHGVAKIAEKITEEIDGAPDPAEVILLMPWAAGTGGDAKIDHYKEVVYRTGRSGGFKVAPAGLAWAEAGSPVSSTSHPSADGAYIAAASIFSRIWEAEGTTSTYTYGDGALGTSVSTTVAENIGEPQYEGKFDFQSPFKMFNFKERNARPRKTGGGTSTEDDLVGRSSDAVRRTGTIPGSGTNFYIGRDTGVDGSKDYRNGPDHLRAFGYVYHWEGSNIDNTLGNIMGEEIELADDMIQESDNYRLCPRRILLAGILQFDPNTNIVSGGHAYGPQATAQGTYMYTLFSGRTPVDSEPDTITTDWYAQKEGYEMAWRVGTLQVRAPGMKALPTSSTIGKESPELLTVEFLNQPQEDVTVNISSTSSDVIITPQTLTFTDGDYMVPQQISVIAKPGATVGATLSLDFSTSSDDEVFNDVDDTWAYVINTPPLAIGQTVEATQETPSPITLTGSDVNGEALDFRIIDTPAHGTVILNGPVAIYTSSAGYTGPDSFTFRASDRSDESAPATINIDVIPMALYDFNLLSNPSAELDPFTDYGWVEAVGTWSQGASTVDGSWSFRPNVGVAELYQDVDIRAYFPHISLNRQSFTFSGYGASSNDIARVILEFRDATQQVLTTHDSGKIGSGESTFYTSDYSAPANATSLRVRLLSTNDRGRTNGATHDGLSLTASVPPANQVPVALNGAAVVNIDSPGQGIMLTGTDGDGDPLTYVLAGLAPSHGTLTGTAPNLAYQPDAGFSGQDSFQFRVTDTLDDSQLATVTLNITPISQPSVVNVGYSSNGEGHHLLSGKLTTGAGADAWICWGDDDAGATTTNAWDNAMMLSSVGEGSDFEVSVNGLIEGKTYWLRCFVSNSEGSAWAISSMPFQLGVSGTGQSVSLAANLNGHDSITGASQNNVGLGYFANSGNLIGSTGSNGTRQARNVVMGYLLPTLPYGAKLTSATLTFTLTDVKSSPTLDVYLLDTVNPDDSGSTLYYEGAVSSTATAKHIGFTNQSPVTEVSFTLTGEALTMLQGFYGGDHIPEQDEAFFRFNLRAGEFSLTRYFIDTAVAGSSLDLGGVTGAILNSGPSSLSSDRANLNASLSATGTNYDVSVYWGTTDGGTDPANWDHNATVGSFTDVETDISQPVADLTPGAQYFYAFRAQNGLQTIWSQPSWCFSTPSAQAPSAFSTWSGGLNFAADNNGDGVSNGLAWVLGATNPSQKITAMMPTAEVGDNSPYMTFEYRRSDQAHNATNTTIFVEYSDDLIDWTPAVDGVNEVVITETDNDHGPGIDRVEVKVPTALATNGELFVRLHVTTGP